MKCYFTKLEKLPQVDDINVETLNYGLACRIPKTCIHQNLGKTSKKYMCLNAVIVNMSI